MVDTAVMLSRLDSMEPAAAAADAAEIGRIISQAEAVAERLRAAFASDALVGAAADAARAAGGSVADEIASVGNRLQVGRMSLEKSGAALEATVAYRPRIAALEALKNAPDSVRLAARTVLSGELTGAYNGRMAETAAAVVPDFVGGSVVTSRNGSADAVGSQSPASAPTAGSDASPDLPGSAWDEAAVSPPGDAAATGDGLTGSVPTEGTPQTGPDAADSAGPAPSAPTSSPALSPAGTSTSPPSAPPGATTGGPAGPTPIPVGAPVGAPAPGIAGQRVTPGSVPASGRAGGLSTGQPQSLRPTGPSPTSGLPAGGTQSAGAGTAQPTTPGGTGGTGPRSGQMPYGPGPVARRSADETGHRPADYLRSTTEGLLLLGPQPIVGPPVIGQLAGPQAPVEGRCEEVAGDLVDLDDDADQELDPTL